MGLATALAKRTKFASPRLSSRLSIAAGVLLFSTNSRSGGCCSSYCCSRSGFHMAKSKFEYTRTFEQQDRCLPNSWIVVRVDGRNFHRFSEIHNFAKPNDDRSLKLMNKCAEAVLSNFNEIAVAYGQSDEYSFVFKRKAETYNRRSSKLSSSVVSVFTSNYVFHWDSFFSTEKLQYPPSFDSRVVLYPTTRNLRDYLNWRQVDCHINNLYNLCFWKLVIDGGKTKREAESILKVTDSAKKNELLFSDFGINYNNETEMHKKGTVIFREKVTLAGPENEDMVEGGTHKKRCKDQVMSDHVDIIKEHFWQQHPSILNEVV